MKDTKAFLARVELIDVAINAKLEELQHLKDMVLRITPTMSDSGGGSGSGDKLGQAVAKIVDMEAEIDRAVDRFVEAKKTVTDVLDQITDPDEYAVLHKRYIQYKKLDQIAADMGFSRQWVCKIHGRALITVKKIREKQISC